MVFGAAPHSFFRISILLPQHLFAYMKLFLHAEVYLACELNALRRKAIMKKATIEGVVSQRENPSRDAFLSLIRISGLMDQAMQAYFGRFGITRSQWAVLRNLYRAESENMSGLRPADIGNKLLVRPPSVTGLIDRLERLGYVRRKEYYEDLRAKEIRLTELGRSAVERILPGHPNQIASIMQGLDEEELKQLHILLQRLGTHLASTMGAGRHHGAEDSPVRPLLMK
jgi:DNA-binding MarR family transcriptional regulator